MRLARPLDKSARSFHGKVTRFIESRMDLGRDGTFPVLGGREWDVVIP